MLDLLDNFEVNMCFFKKEDIPNWLDMDDIDFFWDEANIEFDSADEDFFNNL
jgi:hypothetical protein